MRYVLLILVLLVSGRAWGYDDLVLPKVDFSATAVHEAGAFLSKETIHYTHGKLRIERGNGFGTTILDLTTQTQYVLMVDRTYLVMPMDDQLFRRYIARTVAMSGAQKRGTERVGGLVATKYAFGEEGGLNPQGFYWLSDTGIMVRREYDNGLFGKNMHNREFLTNITIKKQPAEMFAIPAGYKRVG